MKKTSLFSISRWWGIVLKEFLQLRRDRVTFAIMVGIPVIQLALFGFAINTDPKHLPTAVVSYDSSDITRTFVHALQTSDYFAVDETITDEKTADEALKKGTILFSVTIPATFTKQVLRGEEPAILLQADASDPIAAASALGAIDAIAAQVSQKDLTGSFAYLSTQKTPFEVRIHRLYNPEGITQYNIVPGLMGVILTMSLVMMTALAVTREREKGTMENLLASPARPFEIMFGKIIPYIFIGLVQVTIILAAATLVFGVPFEGSILSAYGVALLFIAVNLTIGIAISAVAQNMLQALQLTFFYFLPSILLSGFMFPFLGMPKWAQTIGDILPLTYFNRLIRAIVLKGSGIVELWPNIWPLLIIGAITMFGAVRFYKKTLD